MHELLVTGTGAAASAAHPTRGAANWRSSGAIAVVAALIAGAFLLGQAGAGGAKSAEPLAVPSTSNAFMGLTDRTEPYDLRFIDEMVAHHAGAIISVQTMITNSTHPELRDLGRRIVQVQQQQIDQMLAWRGQWYPSAPQLNTIRMGMMSGGIGMMGGGGMMSGGVLTTTNGLVPSNGMMGDQGMMGGVGTTPAGVVADRMFLRMMIPHHQLAIDMAQDTLAHSQHEELKQLSRAIIRGQSSEITEMEGYLMSWYSEESTRHLAAPMREMMQRMTGGTNR
jgi:uncharacterized protein (DUF305 family)